MVTTESLATALAPRYVVERELGRGGMAAVFLARDTRIARHVAIKVLDPALSRSVDSTRFLHEIRTTANLGHPHILPLYDSGEAEGLLYYVMPHVAGESLRDRLTRQGRLTVDEAVRIGIDIADALACAHDHGVVHRDVKPENILLGDGIHVYVADFGLARALATDAEERLTSTGLAMGSPLYMSPEQIAGEKEIDGRADVYSLGCVLYELLTGRPPFTAPAVPGVLARHLTERPRPLRELQPEAPPFIAAAIERALEKRPRDRFAGATDLARALRAESGATAAGGFHDPRTRRRLLRGALGMGVVLLGAAAVRLGVGDWFAGGRAGLDSTAYVVLVPAPADDSLSHLLAQTLFASMSDWRGIRVDESRPADDIVGAPQRLLDVRALHRAARKHAAAFVVGLMVQRRGPGLVVTATRYDARLPRSPPRRVSAVIATQADSLIERAIAGIADSVLFRAPPRWSFGPHAGGTKVFPARVYFEDAVRALASWDLVRADSSFAAAVSADPAYAQAHLWLGHVRHWRDEPSEKWIVPIGQALRFRDAMTPADRARASALDDIARRAFPSACARYDSLIAGDGRDFIAWYGAAECRRLDGVVVASSDSESGWAFRGSYNAAVSAYERVFDIEPGMVKAFSQGAYDALRGRLFTSSVRLRSGSSASGARFSAYPEWRDTLLFVPYPRREFERTVAHQPPPGHALAVSRLRAVFDRITARWVTAAPNDAEALLARGVALEFIDPERAQRAYRQARSLATPGEEALRAGAAEFWLRVKLAIPSAPEELMAARSLADSLLQQGTRHRPERVSFLAAVAGLVGRIDDAAAYAQYAVAARMAAPESSAAVFRLGGRALAFAAFGRAGELAAVEAEIRRAVDGGFPEPERAGLMSATLARALMVAAPFHRSPITSRVLDPRMPVALLLAGDTIGSRQAVTQQDDARRSRAACDVTLDVLYVDAWVMSQVGLGARAAERLDQTLRALRYCEPQLLGDVAIAGALRQAIALRRQLAIDSRDSATAKEWENVMRALESAHGSL